MEAHRQRERHWPREARVHRPVGRARRRRLRRPVRGVGDAQPVGGHGVQPAGHAARGRRQRHRRLLRLLPRHRHVSEHDLPGGGHRVRRRGLLRDAHPHRPPFLQRAARGAGPEPGDGPPAAYRGAHRRDWLVRGQLRRAAQQVAPGLLQHDGDLRGAGVGDGVQAAPATPGYSDGLPTGGGEERVPEQPQRMPQRHQQLPHWLRVPLRGGLRGQPIPRRRRRMPDKFMCFGICANTLGAYQCRCPPGSRGNPQIKDGCVKSSLGLGVGIGIGCGAGLLLLILGVFFVTRKLKQQRAKVLKKKFFRQNRGHLLQQLVSQKADIAERMIIPLVELEKATNNFDKAREIDGGGHGTVYKGIMSDLHVVAIKKSKVVVQREIDEFIDEVAILSQINHRNVVKLFGCCLETEVPLLVYEFISNGTLYDHLHVEEPEASLPWVERPRIATETARAFAYLHSAVSIPIVHRDIKSQNMLLDGTFIAKVSDFGASRCIPIDQTGDATAIQGTFGYLDPMYYYFGQLTEKSDVYSFGVLLMELLTRKKPCSYRSSEEKSLVAYFTALLATGDLASLLDPQVVQEGGKMVEEVALLAAACVRMEEGQRPTMRQVEMTLENLRVPHGNVVMSDMDAPSYAMIEGGKTEEVSRQYSQEEEYLLSSRYPR
ncbi:hypothetical protein VPH35_085130 [Triticum aestivum]